MPLPIGRRIEHQGQTLIVGHGGRLYTPRTSVDAWGRTRQTQKVTKYRIVTCGCGRTFIAHDGRRGSSFYVLRNKELTCANVPLAGPGKRA